MGLRAAAGGVIISRPPPPPPPPREMGRGQRSQEVNDARMNCDNMVRRGVDQESEESVPNKRRVCCCDNRSED